MMKGILTKLGEEYKLYSHDSCIATTRESPHKRLSKQNCDEIFEYIRQYIQQPKEIEVVVEMESIPADRAPDGWDVFLKLDENGCLILTRLIY